jgi:quercetin dioxygenase-like cupin family protein
MRPGDTVWTPPGDERWHAATTDNMMCHLAMLEASPAGMEPEPVTTAPPFEDLHVGPAPD